MASGGAPVAAEESVDGTGGQRWANQVALPERAPVFGQETQLFIHLQSLADHLDPHILSETKRGFDHRDIFRIGGEAHDQAAIQLDIGQRQLPDRL